jgi:ubiquinone biosynthesis protein Coq4
MIKTIIQKWLDEKYQESHKISYAMTCRSTVGVAQIYLREQYLNVWVVHSVLDFKFLERIVYADPELFTKLDEAIQKAHTMSSVASSLRWHV